VRAKVSSRLSARLTAMTLCSRASSLAWAIWSIAGLASGGRTSRAASTRALDFAAGFPDREFFVATAFAAGFLAVDFAAAAGFLAGAAFLAVDFLTEAGFRTAAVFLAAIFRALADRAVFLAVALRAAVARVGVLVRSFAFDATARTVFALVPGDFARAAFAGRRAGRPGFRAFADAFTVGRRIGLLREVEAMGSTLGTVETW